MTKAAEERDRDRDANRTPAVAIICGSGGFPLAVARSARASGRSPFLIGLKGAAEQAIEAYPHIWLSIGELGKLFSALADRGIRDIAFIGGLARPDFSSLRLDFGAIKRLPDVARILRGGDDHLLTGIIRFFEGQGLRVLGAHELASDLLASPGPLARTEPRPACHEDIRLGLLALDALSPFDSGQAIVVASGHIIAIEAAEGTDEMIGRIAAMRRSGRLRFKGRAGVLVKGPKRNQDLRIDLPVVGPRTIAAALEAELEGLALCAGRVLILDREETIASAERAGLFLYGAPPVHAS